MCPSSTLSLRTRLLQPWPVPWCDVINWTRPRSRVSSCASCTCSKACLRVTCHSISLLNICTPHLSVDAESLSSRACLQCQSVFLQMLCSRTGTRLRRLSWWTSSLLSSKMPSIAFVATLRLHVKLSTSLWLIFTSCSSQGVPPSVQIHGKEIHCKVMLLSESESTAWLQVF